MPEIAVDQKMSDESGKRHRSCNEHGRPIDRRTDGRTYGAIHIGRTRLRHEAAIGVWSNIAVTRRMINTPQDVT